MTLRPYSVNPPRLALQVVVDLFVLGWIYLWYRIGLAVHDAVASSASVGYGIQNSAGGVAGSLNEAGRNMGNAPIIGSSLSGPLLSAAKQIGGVADNGRDLGDRLLNAATPAGWIVALAPILVVVAFWLPARWRFARRAGAAAELAQSPAGEELLALRALVSRPLHELQRVAPDPLVAFRSGDPDAVRALAGLELADAGAKNRYLARRPATTRVGGGTDPDPGQRPR
jgi:hypothetical protein